MREIRTSGLTRGRGNLPPYSTVSSEAPHRRDFRITPTRGDVLLKHLPA